jgi:hypothetical protein
MKSVWKLMLQGVFDITLFPKAPKPKILTDEEARRADWEAPDQDRRQIMGYANKDLP